MLVLSVAIPELNWWILDECLSSSYTEIVVKTSLTQPEVHHWPQWCAQILQVRNPGWVVVDAFLIRFWFTLERICINKVQREMSHILFPVTFNKGARHSEPGCIPALHETNWRMWKQKTNWTCALVSRPTGLEYAPVCKKTHSCDDPSLFTCSRPVALPQINKLSHNLHSQKWYIVHLKNKWCSFKRECKYNNICLQSYLLTEPDEALKLPDPHIKGTTALQHMKNTAMIPSYRVSATSLSSLSAKALIKTQFVRPGRSFTPEL